MSSVADVSPVVVNDGASFAPVIPIVTVIVSDAVPSVTVTVKASETEAPAARALVSASALFRVYVHAAPENAMDPYVPEPLLLAEYDSEAESSASVPETVPVAVEVLASSTTVPV